jgi:hypothetical protein
MFCTKQYGCRGQFLPGAILHDKAGFQFIDWAAGNGKLSSLLRLIASRKECLVYRNS